MLQIDLATVLPNVPDAEDPCVQRLSQSVEGRPGVCKTHVIQEECEGPVVICVHYDAAEMEAARLREIVQATGTRLTDQFSHRTWITPSIPDEPTAEKASERLREIEGVISVQVESGRQIQVEYDPERIQEVELQGVLALMGIHADT